MIYHIGNRLSNCFIWRVFYLVYNLFCSFQFKIEAPSLFIFELRQHKYSLIWTISFFWVGEGWKFCYLFMNIVPLLSLLLSQILLHFSLSLILFSLFFILPNPVNIPSKMFVFHCEYSSRFYLRSFSQLSLEWIFCVRRYTSFILLKHFNTIYVDI